MTHGETNLDTLLRNISPILQDGIYVFCSSPLSFEEVLHLNPVLIFQEAEGTALIIKKETAEQESMPFHFPSRMITLNVHSSLDAIGFLARITQKLAQEGISVNSVSAHYHDHLFIPVERAQDAMRCLQSFST